MQSEVNRKVIQKKKELGIKSERCPRGKCRFTSNWNGKVICSWCGMPGKLPSKPYGRIVLRDRSITIPNLLTPEHFRWLTRELVRGLKKDG